jgi:hypothetical protein
MAARNHTRAKSARPVQSQSVSKLPTAVAELLAIRQRLALVMAVVYVTGAALKAQDADSDAEAALILQRSIGDELDRQIERLDMVKP